MTPIIKLLQRYEKCFFSFHAVRIFFCLERHFFDKYSFFSTFAL